MSKLRVLDLFSGIGGFSLGLERTGGFETAAFCEYEEFPRKVLAKHWPNVPCFPDVRELKGSDIDGPIDVICGGYPCQPFSTAGQRRGKEDDRHLWPEFSRLVAELRPTWIIGENVAGHISMGLDDVLSDLEGQGYSCRTFVIPACAVDAPHRRDRVWIVAHAEKLQRDGGREYSKQGQRQISKSGKRGRADDVAYTNGVNAQRQHQLPSERHDAGTRQSGFIYGEARPMAHAERLGQSRQGEYEQPGHREAEGKGQADHAQSERQHRKRRTEPGVGGMADGLPAGMDGPCRWPDEPDIGRVAKGVKDRAKRLKALGNAVVPQIPEMIGHAILQAEAAA